MKLRFAVIGTGFWANYQIPAWLELPKVQLVALCDIEKDKAQALADLYGIARVYDQVEEMLASEELDFVDIITGVDTHATFTELAAKKGIGVICQKPMAPTLHKAKMMVEVCRKWNVPFAVHENFRWQRPLRQLKEFLDNEVIGSIFKARVTFCSGFPVFDNQPFLKKLDKFILMDVGSHILDVCRFLFGEVENLLCHTRTVNPEINGEDVANVLLKMKNGISCFAEMSYASILERESFPQTLVLRRRKGIPAPGS
ncbi:MAG: Gfo/Idh/MocA family oxidoreductase [Bacteroidota bacterium]